MVDEENLIIKSTLRGFNRAIILWSISKTPMSGYSIVKELEQLTGQKFHRGAVYPLLYELEKKGFLKGTKMPRGRSNTKCYSITSNGLKLLNQLREVLRMPLKEAMAELIGEET